MPGPHRSAPRKADDAHAPRLARARRAPCASERRTSPRTECARRAVRLLLATCLALHAAGIGAAADSTRESYEPRPGQPGKDVVWVPTNASLVEKMLDLAKVTPRDFVIDLGSGDGRNVIAAAKRGARALGVEYNPQLVALAKEIAAREGVADKASFVQGDMFQADISQATVLALFLVPDNLRKLTPKFLALKPGARIVTNHYEIEGWEADETARPDGPCIAWCVALLYVVPADVAGTWTLPIGKLDLDQSFQKVSGTLSTEGLSASLENGRLRGEHIRFTIGHTDYAGVVEGDTMRLTASGPAHETWTAKRIAP
jgi:SAM-dependent methyltransferase